MVAPSVPAHLPSRSAVLVSFRPHKVSLMPNPKSKRSAYLKIEKSTHHRHVPVWNVFTHALATWVLIVRQHFCPIFDSALSRRGKSFREAGWLRETPLVFTYGFRPRPTLTKSMLKGTYNYFRPCSCSCLPAQVNGMSAVQTVSDKYVPFAENILTQVTNLEVYGTGLALPYSTVLFFLCTVYDFYDVDYSIVLYKYISYKSEVRISIYSHTYRYMLHSLYSKWTSTSCKSVHCTTVLRYV